MAGDTGRRPKGDLAKDTLNSHTAVTDFEGPLQHVQRRADARSAKKMRQAWKGRRRQKIKTWDVLHLEDITASPE
jgi:hypothetical protein